MSLAKQRMPFERGVIARCPRSRSAHLSYLMYLTLVFLLLSSFAAFPQATLDADGVGNTYELINSVLGGTAERFPIVRIRHSAGTLRKYGTTLSSDTSLYSPTHLISASRV